MHYRAEKKERAYHRETKKKVGKKEGLPTTAFLKKQLPSSFERFEPTPQKCKEVTRKKRGPAPLR